MNASHPSALRQLPPVHALLETEQARDLCRHFPRQTVREEVREGLEQVRRALRTGSLAPFSTDTFFESVRRRLEERSLRRLQRVINATGIVIHTNMGRAPLAAEAVRAVQEVAGCYSNLELDLVLGRRGERGGEIEPLLRRLTGAEAALVVNNNAAAVLLALSTLAKDGEVILSRGEMVEIGGAFRIPDVIRQSGARLVEVGTTNKTRLSDYAQAITPDTKALLKVHASNYRIIGFTAEVPLAEIVALSHEKGIAVMQDLGSGALINLARYGLPQEPTVGDAVRSGVDVVAFSGDKLLGGPQSGIVVGKSEIIRQMGSNPLFRAVRADKMTLAALEATLQLYEDEERLIESLPVLQMLCQSSDQLLKRARRLRRGLSAIPGLEVTIADSVGYSGGGTLPEAGLPTKRVRIHLKQKTIECLSEDLRRRQPPIVGVLAEGYFVMDVRTIRDSEVPEIVQAFRDILLRGNDRSDTEMGIGAASENAAPMSCS